MKSTDYRLQKEIKNIKPDNQEWFKDFVREVLESKKPYYAKADYLGLSIKELDNKISYLAEDIKEMQALKKSLTQAKAIALESIASVLQEYGIDRLDGTAISSITITPETTKVKEELIILDESSLIELGYFKAMIDKDAIMQVLENSNRDADAKDDIHRYTQIESSNETTPARIKVNAKRNSQNNQASELLKLVDSQEAA